MKLINRLNVLGSYAYMQKEAKFIDAFLAISDIANVLIDSGAYSNFKFKAKRLMGQKTTLPPVTLKNYIRDCQTLFHGKVWQYIALDVVREPDATDRNLRAMIEAGLTPMPVVIEGIPASKVVELTTTNKRLCVAGAVFGNDHYLRRRYETVLRESGGVAKIHALGFARYPTMFNLPVASADSSSYCMGGQFGKSVFYDRRKGFYGMEWTDMLSPKTPTAKKTPLINFLLDRCDVPAAWIKDPKRYRTPFGIASMSCTYAYLQFMKQAEETGRDYFCAVVNENWLFPLVGVLGSLTPKGFDYPKALSLCKQLQDYAKNRRSEYYDVLRGAIQEGTTCLIQPHSL